MAIRNSKETRFPKVGCQVNLGSQEAAGLWNYVLAQQGLTSSTRIPSVIAIAEATLGLHAARLQSPFATVLARATDPSVALCLFTPETRGHMVTVRCMRKTLHVLPPRLAAAAHAATVSFRKRDTLRAIANAGMSRRAVLRCIEGIIDLLSREGPLFFRLIETSLVNGRRSQSLVRLALKLAWETGILVYLNRATGWDREERSFAVASKMRPDLNMALDEEDARRQLVEAYIERYGPASMRDASWWSGLPRSVIVRALCSAERELVAIKTPWSDSELFMFRESFEKFQEQAVQMNDCRRRSVNFLAHEDVALKAYFETRERYLQGVHPSAAFNQIGEALPTITLGGRVIGTWSWDRQSKSVRWLPIEGFTREALRKELDRRSDLLSDALRLGLQQQCPTRIAGAPMWREP